MLIAWPNWPRRISGPCVTTPISFTANRRAAFGRDDGVFDVLDVSDQAHFAHIDLLLALVMKLPPALRVVIGQLLLHLADAQSVGDELVGVEAHLIFARRTAKGIGIDEHPERLFRFFSITQVSSVFRFITSYSGLVLCRV